MRRSHRFAIGILAVIVVAGLPLAGSQRVLANTVRGVLRLPADALDEARVPIRGFWRIPNGALPIAPPLVSWQDRALVVLESETPIGAPTTVELDMSDARFTPPAVLVQAGGAVRFVNRDTVLHLLEPVEGAFMTSESVGPGEAATHTFDKPGIFLIRCSEVTHMRAAVVVVKYGQSTTIDASGSFRFTNVPNGVHKLRVWFDGAWVFEQAIDARGKPVFVEATVPTKAANKE